MSSLLFRGGVVRPQADDARAAWLLVEDGVCRAYGGRGEEPRADRSIDLGGGTLIPAFCDDHVHLPATGLFAAAINLRGLRSKAEILGAIERRARQGSGILLAGGFEDPQDGTLSRHDVDAVVGDRPALVTRADLHSCVVSSALLQNLDLGDLEGVDRDAEGQPTGYLREHAKAAAWQWFESNLPPDAQAEAVRSAIELAYSKGITRVHEMFVVEWRGWGALELFLSAISDSSIDVTPYVATAEVERVKELGLARIGGDFFLDGSFGSHTAWMRQPYATPPPAGGSETGIAYRSDAEVYDLFQTAQRAGLQVGVHAIGDAAIDQALLTWERVAQEVGLEAIRALQHRIEHFECATDDHIARAARLGLGASIQPAFDRLWGGPQGLYSQRIGWERAANMNRFKTMRSAGLVVGAGSDSTVTPLDPFLQMTSLREHHLEAERFTAAEALTAHTRGSTALSGRDWITATLEPGQRADVAWLDRDPIEVDSEELLKTEVIGTWIAGLRVWPLAAAEAS